MPWGPLLAPKVAPSSLIKETGVTFGVKIAENHWLAIRLALFCDPLRGLRGSSTSSQSCCTSLQPVKAAIVSAEALSGRMAVTRSVAVGSLNEVRKTH